MELRGMEFRGMDDPQDSAFFLKATVILGQDPIMVAMRHFHDFLAETFPQDNRTYL